MLLCYDMAINRPPRARSACPLVLATLVCLLTDSAAAPQESKATPAPSTARVPRPATDAPLRIHIISGSKEYASAPSLRRFKEELER